jgi:hypothetical protein
MIAATDQIRPGWHICIKGNDPAFLGTMPTLTMSALRGKADTSSPRSAVCYDPKQTYLTL